MILDISIHPLQGGPMGQREGNSLKFQQESGKRDFTLSRLRALEHL
jgi:hypothetical protein